MDSTYGYIWSQSYGGSSDLNGSGGPSDHANSDSENDNYLENNDASDHENGNNEDNDDVQSQQGGDLYYNPKSRKWNYSDEDDWPTETQPL